MIETTSVGHREGGPGASLRVLQVVTDTDRRGAQMFAYELGQALPPLGLDVRTVALARGHPDGLPLDALGPTRRSPRTILALRRAMAGADITVAHGSTTLFACGLAGLGPGRPFVYRQISDPVFWTPTATKRARTHAFYRLPRHVVALSPSTSAALQGRFRLPDSAITVIPNAVQPRPPARADDRAAARRRLGVAPPPAPVLAYVGALVPEKGVADLIAALPPDAALLVAGDGPDRAALGAQAERADGACHFLGPVSDPWDVYAAADALVVPSRGGDTQPAVLIEAALVGTPVIATDIGAIPDIVIDGRTGLLSPPGDVDGLRAVITSLLADHELRARLARDGAGRATAEFSMPVVACRWAEVLRATAR